jgi:cell wall-associated NlpC family hydrolase
MNRKKSVSQKKPRCKSGLSWFLRGNSAPLSMSVLVIFAWCGLAMTFSSCGPTAPRFRSGDSTTSGASGRGESQRQTSDSVRSKDQDVETSAEGIENVEKRTFKTEKNTSISNLDQARMMREISKMMGVSYKLGGMDENGIDCSAYTMTVYRNSISRQLPRSSAEQYKIGIPVDYNDLKFGDLVFFDTTGDPASHVGIYLGDDLFAHASVSLGVTISSLESFYFKKRYNGARRIVQ